MRDAIEVLAASLAPIVAIFGTYIAWRQHRLQRHRLRLDLYDKRFAVFQSLMEFLSVILRDAKVPLEQYYVFRTRTAQAAFLFGDDVNRYLEQIVENAMRFRELNERLGTNAMPMGVERTELVTEESELLRWLSGQIEQARTLFSKYIAFTEI
jgi:hypothetical protein